MSHKHDEAIERAVDAIRLALSAIARVWADAAIVRALSCDLKQSKAGAVLCEIDTRQDEAWSTIRPALRKLVEEVTEIEKGKP